MIRSDGGILIDQGMLSSLSIILKFLRGYVANQRPVPWQNAARYPKPVHRSEAQDCIEDRVQAPNCIRFVRDGKIAPGTPPAPKYYSFFEVEGTCTQLFHLDIVKLMNCRLPVVPM